MAGITMEQFFFQKYDLIMASNRSVTMTLSMLHACVAIKHVLFVRVGAKRWAELTTARDLSYYNVGDYVVLILLSCTLELLYIIIVP